MFFVCKYKQLTIKLFENYCTKSYRYNMPICNINCCSKLVYWFLVPLVAVITLVDYLQAKL
jgi:hypothetical protein